MTSRETIYAALFSLLSASAGFNTTSRRLVVWDDVPQDLQPALFQNQKKEIPTGQPGLNQVWTLTVDIFIYAHNMGDKSTAPSTIINPLIDAVQNAIAPDPVTNKQTLGGLVQHAGIEGSIVTDEGVLGDQAVAIIPISIKVA